MVSVIIVHEYDGKFSRIPFQRKQMTSFKLNKTKEALVKPTLHEFPMAKLSFQLELGPPLVYYAFHHSKT